MSKEERLKIKEIRHLDIESKACDTVAITNSLLAGLLGVSGIVSIIEALRGNYFLSSPIGSVLLSGILLSLSYLSTLDISELIDTSRKDKQKIKILESKIMKKE